MLTGTPTRGVTSSMSCQLGPSLLGHQGSSDKALIEKLRTYSEDPVMVDGREILPYKVAVLLQRNSLPMINDPEMNHRAGRCAVRALMPIFFSEEELKHSTLTGKRVSNRGANLVLKERRRDILAGMYFGFTYYEKSRSSPKRK